jgi:hypothetical protein
VNYQKALKQDPNFPPPHGIGNDFCSWARRQAREALPRSLGGWRATPRERRTAHFDGALPAEGATDKALAELGKMG